MLLRWVIEETILIRLHKKVQALDQKCCALLDEVEVLDIEQLEAKSLPNKWSILEIVEHLVIAERYVFRGFPKVSQLVELKRSFRTRFTYQMVLFILEHNIPVKVPSSKMIPQSNTSLPELRCQWDENHKLIKSYVDSFDKNTLCKTFFKHPVTGPITLEKAVILDQIHLSTHVQQIRKLQRLLSILKMG